MWAKRGHAASPFHGSHLVHPSALIISLLRWWRILSQASHSDSLFILNVWLEHASQSLYFHTNENWSPSTDEPKYYAVRMSSWQCLQWMLVHQEYAVMSHKKWWKSWQKCDKALSFGSPHCSTPMKPQCQSLKPNKPVDSNTSCTGQCF